MCTFTDQGARRQGREGKGKSFTCKGFLESGKSRPGFKEQLQAPDDQSFIHSRGKHLFLIKDLINNRVKSACDGETLSPAQTPQVFR